MNSRFRLINSTPDETTRFLTAQYPRVHRLSIGLCGDAALAAAVTQTIMTQSLDALRRWRNDAEAENWFVHHVLLESRNKKPAAWSWCGAANPQLMAFARALVGLPFQQKEAFLLTHGEKLDLRGMAIAMDCSSTAAANHLAAATKTLRASAGLDFERLTIELVAAYLAPPPPPELMIQKSIRAAARRRAGRRIAAILLAILAAIAAYAGYRIYQMLDY